MSSSSSDPSVTRVSLLLGTVVALAVFGSSAVAVALPSLGQDLGIELSGRAWVLAAFSVTFSISTAVFGRIADLVGLRLPLRIGIVAFALGAAGAALAQNFPMLIAGRLLQGAGAGAVPVLSIGIIAARFDAERRTRALGGLVAMVAAVSGSGPLLGGALAQFAGWRWVLAVPAVTLLLMEPIARFAPTWRSEQGNLDVHGAAFVTAIIVGLVLLLQSPSTGADTRVIAGATVLAGGGAGLLARHVRERPDGFLPRAVITSRAFVLGTLTGFSILAAYLSLMLAIPQLLSDERGWSPLQIGLTLVPGAAIGAVASRFVGATAQRWGRYRLVAILAAGSAAGLVLAAAAPTSPAALAVALALASSAFAGGQVALVDGIPALVEDRHRGVAIGLFNLVFFTGGAVGAAATGGLAGVLTLPGALAVLAFLPALGAAAALAAGRSAEHAAAAHPEPDSLSP